MIASKGAACCPAVLPANAVVKPRRNARLPTLRSESPAALSRRRLGALLLGAGATLLLPQLPASSAGLRSQLSQAPAVITFRNELDSVVKVYWINYSGDPEFYAAIPPAGWWTVDTFESHPWRVVDGGSGEVLREFVSPGGASLVRIDPLQQQAQPSAREAQPGSEQPLPFAGWDGVGGSESEYAPAAIAEIGLDHLGGVALLTANGFPMPIPIAVGINDAAQLFHAAGAVPRRAVPCCACLFKLPQLVQAAGERHAVRRCAVLVAHATLCCAVPCLPLASSPLPTFYLYSPTFTWLLSCTFYAFLARFFSLQVPSFAALPPWPCGCAACRRQEQPWIECSSHAWWEPLCMPASFWRCPEAR